MKLFPQSLNRHFCTFKNQDSQIKLCLQIFMYTKMKGEQQKAKSCDIFQFWCNFWHPSTQDCCIWMPLLFTIDYVDSCHLMVFSEYGEKMHFFQIFKLRFHETLLEIEIIPNFTHKNSSFNFYGCGGKKEVKSWTLWIQMITN